VSNWNQIALCPSISFLKVTSNFSNGECLKMPHLFRPQLSNKYLMEDDYVLQFDTELVMKVHENFLIIKYFLLWLSEFLWKWVFKYIDQCKKNSDFFLSRSFFLFEIFWKLISTKLLFELYLKLNSHWDSELKNVSNCLFIVLFYATQ